MLSPTREQVDSLVARYAEVPSLRLLAVESGFDRATIRAHLKTRGVQLGEQTRLTQDQIAKAAELYSQGRSSAAIGKLLGCDNKTVLSALRTAGVSIRPRSGPQAAG